MKIGVLGAGDVGRTLASGFIGRGDQVMLGSRDAQQDKIREWVSANGKLAAAGSYAETAAYGEVLVLAVLGTAIEEVIRHTGAQNFAGKTLIDTTNGLDFSKGFPPTMYVGATDSLGERVQQALPAARVVKAFNMVGAALMVHPKLTGGPPDMFICGNDDAAKQEVTAILHDFGWPAIDIGGIESARYLEPLAMVWVLSAVKANSWVQAFKMLR